MKSKLSSFALASLALFSYQSYSNRSFLVDGAISIQTEVQCLLDNPTVCIGQQTELGPTPAIECSDLSDPTSCKTIYIGGYTYQYTFVEGLEEGNTDVEAIERAKTGSTVTVYIDDDESSCEVAIGIHSCITCSTDGCTTSGFPNAVKYDCSNLAFGRSNMDECTPLEPFLYPIRAIEAPSAVLKDERNDETTDETKDETKDEKRPEKKLRAAGQYSDSGQVPLGFIALGMIIFVLVVGFLSK